MFHACLVSVFLAPDLILSPKVPVSLVHEKVVEAFGTEISRVECYSATVLPQFGVFCTLCLSEFIIVYRDLTPQRLAHPV